MRYFKILAPGEADAAMFIGTISGNQFEATPPASGDDSRLVRPGPIHATDPGRYSCRKEIDRWLKVTSRLVLVLPLGAGMSVTAAAPAMAKEVLAQRLRGGEMSAAFGQQPQDILTVPLERDPGGYVVHGQYPPDGSRAKTV